MQRARCTNFGVCSRADSKRIIELSPGQKAVCPECGQPVVLLNDSGNSKSPVLSFIGILVVLSVLGGLGYFAYERIVGNNNNNPVDLTPIPIVNPPNPVPSVVPPPIASTPNTGDIPHLQSNLFLLYEKSGQKWINEAVKNINGATGGGQIRADYIGSREGMQNLLFRNYGQNAPDAPALWNPADLYWARKANRVWRNGDGHSLKPHDSDLLSEPVVILQTRLCFVIWSDRAELFQRAMGSDRYRGRTWQLLHDLAVSGWVSIGGSASWGKLKMAQSNPLKSNSGMVALGLMYGEWRRAHTNANETDAQFAHWLRETEDAVVHGDFADTTSNALKTLRSGTASDCDMAIVYEQNAVTAADEDKSLRIIYPDPTANVRFPLCVVRANWVSPAQAQDAQKVSDYLLSQSVQESAVRYGFRPGLTTLRSVVSDSLNTPQRTAYGFRMDAPVDENPASTDTYDNLQGVWKRLYRPNEH